MTNERELRTALAPLFARIEQQNEMLERVIAINQVLLARMTDVGRVSIAEAARLRGVSKPTARRMLAPYIERNVAGIKGDSVPIEKVFSFGWMPLEMAKRLASRIQKQAA